MSFIEAVLNANRAIDTLLRQEKHQESLHKAFDIGYGGDRSRGMDLEAERIFVKHLHSFGTLISEESGVFESSLKSCEGVEIIIDPIDGSDNFLSHLPYYGTSVAFCRNGICEEAVIVNLANHDVFIKNFQGFKRGKLYENTYQDVTCNAHAKVGLFERSYCSKHVLPKLHSLGIKYRSPGAFALSLAYAHEVLFVVYEGELRAFDIAAGVFMCDDLYTLKNEDFFLVSKDKEIFDKIQHLFKENGLV